MKINSIQIFNFKQTEQKYKAKPCNTTFGNKINSVKNSELVSLFETLAKIPSPPLKEQKLATWIMEFCKTNKLNAKFDNYKNIKINIPPTDKTKKSILFSAHMDVVGDDSPINIVFENEFIKTDGKRTLGADDKSGVAVALMLAKEINNGNLKHGGLEMLLTRDEELGMSGILNAEFKDFNSKYVLVLDEAEFGKFDNSGAGFTTVTLSLTTPYGGHSGMDIRDKKRLNAAKMISELISLIPQGVYWKGNNNSVTSINVGTIIAGDIQNTAAKIVENKIVSNDYLDFFMQNSVTNVINTKAMATLSIRSSSEIKENELKQTLINIVENFNQKYKDLLSVNIIFEELIPIFEESEDKTLQNFYIDACKELNISPKISSFPAGAESHIYCKNKNKNGETFIPALLGVADIFNMHSPLEKMNFVSLKKGFELVKEIFLKFNASN